MTIALTPEQEIRWQKLQASGELPNSEYLIDATLDLYENRKQELETLNTNIQEGVDDLKAGRYRTYNQNNAHELLEDIKRRAGELQAERKSSAH